MPAQSKRRHGFEIEASPEYFSVKASSTTIAREYPPNVMPPETLSSLLYVKVWPFSQ